MSFVTVYEIPKHPFPLDSFITLMMFLGTLLIIRQQYARYRAGESTKFKSIIATFFITLLGIVFACLLVYTISYGGTEKREYAEKYFTGQYEILEGTFKIDENANHGVAAFTVNDEEFSFLYLLKNPLPDAGYAKVYFVKGDGLNEVVRLVITA